MPGIDPYSVSTVPTTMYFNSTKLSTGTSFIWENAGSHFLITNWHNLTGKNAATGKHLSATAAEPNQIEVLFHSKTQLGDRVSGKIPIRDQNDAPLWYVHPKLGNRVDAVALPLNLPGSVEPYPINQMASDQLTLQIGMDVFILGYPFGIGPNGLPVWKRGSIASEPEVLDLNSPYVLVDTASRPGMSGSPVIRRSWGTHQYESGTIGMGQGTATRFFGIYSGRLATNDPLDAQLGMVWPAKYIEEIVVAQKRDS